MKIVSLTLILFVNYLSRQADFHTTHLVIPMQVVDLNELCILCHVHMLGRWSVWEIPFGFIWSGGYTKSLRTKIKLCRIWGSHSGDYEEYYLLGYSTVEIVGTQPTFLRNMSPPSSGSKNKPSKKLAERRWETELPELARLILRPWRWRRHVPQKRRLSSSRLHGVISQKI
jgi:hypothetical protein